MISRRHHSKKLLQKRIDRLERINADEEREVIAEVAKIKRLHIHKFGRPKSMTNMPLRGIVSEKDH